MAHVKKDRSPRNEDLDIFISTKKNEAMSESMRLLIALKGEITRLDLLADLSENTKEEFGCGLDHVRDGFRELEDGLLGLMLGS